ncbi:MAG: hypothetical protein QM831_18325 [Kofleriaceae bacterium]
MAASGVEFVVVGLLAAVAQGAPVTTHDLDIVPLRTPDNIELLLRVLIDVLDARYRGRDDVLRPTAEILLGPGHSLLKTNAGPLDVLGAIEGGRDYLSLRPLSKEIAISGHTVHVLGLETIIELKRNSTRLKDQLVVPILEEALRQSRE